MPQVLVPPVSANNVQTLLSLHLSASIFALAYYSMGISLVWDQSINYEGN